MKFAKMQGTGNDYIYVNCFDESIDDPPAAAKFLSDRHFGIGSDGLVLILPSDRADFRMDIYNSDGSRAKMCGNAVRCVAKYVCDSKMTDKDMISLETLSGKKYINIYKTDGKVTSAQVNMGSPMLKSRDIPALIESDTVISRPLEVGEKVYSVTCLSMGNPHCVVFSENIDSVNIKKIGAEFENHPAFPDRINTEFVQPISASRIKMRVWERGAGETLSCGTGACAAAVACILNGYCKRDTDIKISLRGGDLSVKWSADGDVYLTGSAQTVFTGEIAYGGGAR